MVRTEAVIDLAAIAANVATLKSHTAAEVMAVVKADGYGHGMVPAARAALAGGASWLGVAMLDEALALRAAGITEPVLAWLWTPHEFESLRAAVAAGVDVSVASGQALELVVAAATDLGAPARVHLEVDTGLTRNGCTAADWPALLDAAAKAAAAGAVEATGIWSHFANADSPGHPSIDGQLERYGAALDTARARGVVPRLRHLANAAASLTLPRSHFDLIRPGVAVYGLSPVPDAGDFGLVPAMTLRTSVAEAKRVAAGEGVSYGHSYVTERETTLALVPVGYADGVPRTASNVAQVSIGGSRYTISGRVCMDQFMVDVGDAEVGAGDEVLLFGPGSAGEPTAQDWAAALDTINYEIVTRVGPRVPRSYVGGAA